MTHSDSSTRTDHENRDERPTSRLLRCDSCKRFFPARATDGNELVPAGTAYCRSCGGRSFTPVTLDEVQPNDA